MKNMLSNKVIVVLLFVLVFGGGFLFYKISDRSSNFQSTPNSTPTQTDVYNPHIDPTNFVTEVTNPYFPLKTGRVATYEGHEKNGAVRMTVTVTKQPKTILSVQTTEIRDTVYIDEKLHEDTVDWYAQDKQGNVWYFGEDTKEYENGKVVSTEGTWQAGIDGAKPGIIMPATPQVGNPVFQEYYKDHAEDQFQVLSTNESLTLPTGKYEKCLKTKEWTRLNPGIVEHKIFCPGIGFAQSTTVQGGTDFYKLTSIREQ